MLRSDGFLFIKDPVHPPFPYKEIELNLKRNEDRYYYLDNEALDLFCVDQRLEALEHMKTLPAPEEIALFHRFILFENMSPWFDDPIVFL